MVRRSLCAAQKKEEERFLTSTGRRIRGSECRRKESACFVRNDAGGRGEKQIPRCARNDRHGDAVGSEVAGAVLDGALGKRENANLKLLRSRPERVTILGNCGPTVLRGRHRNDSLEHEQSMRRGGCNWAQRSPLQMPSRCRLEECVQRPIR